MKRIRELREQMGISQAELAKRVNVVRSAICQYEKDAREPSYDVLKRLANVFGVSVDYLLGRDERPLPDNLFPLSAPSTKMTH